MLGVIEGCSEAEGIMLSVGDASNADEEAMQ